MSADLGRIPATIVTGFLGAGKTTLIRHLLQNPGGRKIALIVNEFGDVGFDGQVLADCGSEACGAGRHHRARQRLHLLHRRRRFSAGDGEDPRRAPRRPTTSSSRRPAWRCRSRW